MCSTESLVDISRDQGYLCMVKKTVVTVIKKFVAALIKEGISVDKIILYGSHAKGKARPDSNIDVGVVSRSFGKDRTEEGMPLFRIAGGVNVRLEPVPISLKSYKNDTWVP